MGHGAANRSQYLLLLAQLARLLLFLLVTYVLGNALAPADFGFFALVSTLFALAMEVIDMGSAAVATRQIAQAPGSERQVLQALLGWRRLLAAAIAVGCLFLAFSGLAKSDAQRVVLVAAAAGLFFLHQSAYYIVFQVRQAFGKPLLLGLGAQLGFLLASQAALRLAAAGLVVALLVVGREIVQVIGSRLIAIRMLGYRLHADLLSPDLRPLLRQAWKFGLCALLYKMAFHAGTFFVWLMASPEALATYSASLRLFSPVVDTAWIFVTPLIASMSLAVATDAQAFRRQLAAQLSMLSAAASLLAVCGYFLAPTVLSLLYGDRYLHGPLSSLETFRWLSAGFAFALMTPVLVVAFLARREEASLLAISVSGLIANVMVCSWAVPRYGAVGAAIAIAATECLVLLALVARLARTGELRPQLAGLAYLLPALLLGLALSALAEQPHAALALAMVMGPLSLLGLWQLPAQKACRLGVAGAHELAMPVAGSSDVSSIPRALP